MMNYKVFFVSDATAANSDADHNTSLANLGLLFADVRRTEELLALPAQRSSAA
jgi:ureidoacrylate peracid hydrolase